MDVYLLGYSKGHQFCLVTYSCFFFPFINIENGSFFKIVNHLRYSEQCRITLKLKVSDYTELSQECY